MDNGLLPVEQTGRQDIREHVLILIVMDNGLLQVYLGFTLAIKGVLILIVMDNGLLHYTWATI